VTVGLARTDLAGGLDSCRGQRLALGCFAVARSLPTIKNWHFQIHEDDIRKSAVTLECIQLD
jgi:hypothetical protein